VLKNFIPPSEKARLLGISYEIIGAMSQAFRKKFRSRREAELEDEVDDLRRQLAELKARTAGRPAVQRYQYQSISVDGDIRVIELKPGNRHDPVVCELKTMRLIDAEDNYEAISYVWGSQTDQLDILCHGSNLSVTRNLHDALRYLRHPTRMKRLWADAVCIDQTDKTEKGVQVKSMGAVYQKAKRVIIWLGRDKDGIAKDCFELVENTIRYLEAEIAKHDDLEHIPVFGESNPISRDRSKWAKVNLLMDLPWFHRAWVVQEAGLGKDCVLRLGTQELDYAKLVELGLFHCYCQDLDRYMPLRQGRIADTFTEIQCGFDNPRSWRYQRPYLAFWADIAHKERQSFLDVLFTARVLEASDKRDHVYAFLGHPTARTLADRLLVEPDYSPGKTPEDVFFDVACALLLQSKEAPWVLCHVDHLYEEDVEGRDCPSWTPRWDQWEGYVMGFPRSWFRAGGPVESFRPEIRNSKQLVLNGFQFDRIKWTSDTLQRWNLELNPNHWDEEYVDMREPFIDHLFDKIYRVVGDSDPRLEDRFLLALLRGRPSASKPTIFAPPRYRKDYDAYCRHARQLAKSRRGSSSRNGVGESWRLEHNLVYLDSRRMAVTESGQLGIVPNRSQIGDICCIVPGVVTPLILRPLRNGRCNLVGEAYIEGVMDGTFIAELQRSSSRTKTFILE
jgi:hypothetical protein